MNRPCFVCKKPIESARLSIAPETRLCVQHSRSILKFGGEFTLTASQEKTSKVTSLKVNYGGITVKSKRNTDALEDLRESYWVGEID